MSLLKKKQVSLIILIMFFLISCSIDYGNNQRNLEKMPNIVFKNIKLDRYEQNNTQLAVECERLEMYTKDKTWVGKNIEFVQFEKNTSNDEFLGKAGLVLIDNQNEEYFLSEDVEFNAKKDKLKISSSALYWVKKESLLASPHDALVSIEKENEMSIKGSGFIANTSSKEFELSNEIEGEIDTSEPEALSIE
ncbi:MAG: LPS export ABC transporter periplasmic protein LptC [Treponema sp.]